MTTAEAVEILKLHNEWRRGAEVKQHSPKEIGLAIDKVIEIIERLKTAVEQ